MLHPLEAFKFCPRCGSDKFLEKNWNSKKCGACGFEYYKNQASAAVALIYDDEGRLMVTRRAKDPVKGTLDLPGGFVDLNETVEEAVIRELKEETNIDIEIVKYAFCIPNIYFYSGVEVNTLDFFFECKIKDMSNVKLQESEISELLFIGKDELNPDDFGLVSINKAITRLIAG